MRRVRLAGEGQGAISRSMAAPQVFDRALLRHRLARAQAGGYAGFLLEAAAADLEERLSTVVRPFSLALDCGSPGPAAVPVLQRRATTVIRLAPTPEPGTVVGDEERLPFAGERFDLVVSLLSLQAVNDLPGALVQIRRSMKPDGLFMGCLLGGGSLAELRQSFLLAEMEVEGGASPRVAPFADLRDLGTLLQRAGFALPVTDCDMLRVRYANPFLLMQDLRAMGMTNALVERRPAGLRRATLRRAAEIYAERFADPDGRVWATFELVWLSGWTPHASQQKPLRPGSAKVRLADALGVREQRLDED